MPDIIGRTCPFCQAVIKPREQFVVCSQCQTVHHADCWNECGKCTTPGCRGIAEEGVPQRQPQRSRPVQPVATSPEPNPRPKVGIGNSWSFVIIAILVVRGLVYWQQESQKGRLAHARAEQQKLMRQTISNFNNRVKSINTPAISHSATSREPTPGTAPAQQSVVSAMKALNARLISQTTPEEIQKASPSAAASPSDDDVMLTLTVAGLSDEYASEMGRHYGFQADGAKDIVRRFYINTERKPLKDKSGITIAAGDDGTIWYLGENMVKAYFKGGVPSSIIDGTRHLFLYLKGLEQDSNWPIEIPIMEKIQGESYGD